MKTTTLLLLGIAGLIACGKIQKPDNSDSIIMLVQIDNDRYKFDKTANVWNGVKYDSSPGSTDSVRIEPKEGWQEFELILKQYKILSLPDQNDIPDYLTSPVHANSKTYTFSINNNGDVHNFSYVNAEANLLRSWAAQSVVFWGTYLMTEFKEAE